MAIGEFASTEQRSYSPTQPFNQRFPDLSDAAIQAGAPTPAPSVAPPPERIGESPLLAKKRRRKT